MYLGPPRLPGSRESYPTKPTAVIGGLDQLMDAVGERPALFGGQDCVLTVPCSVKAVVDNEHRAIRREPGMMDRPH